MRDTPVLLGSRGVASTSLAISSHIGTHQASTPSSLPREASPFDGRGDRWTVQLNLLGFDSKRLDEFVGILRSSSCLSAVRHAKSTAGYMRDRFAAVGKSSETKKFVNIAARRKACQAMRRLMTELTDAGFGSVSTRAGSSLCSDRAGRWRQASSESDADGRSQTVYGKIGAYLAIAAAQVTSNPDLEPIRVV